MNSALRTISRASLRLLLCVSVGYCAAAAAQTLPTTPTPAAAPATGATTPAKTSAAAPVTTSPAPTGVVGDRNATLLDRVPAEQMLTLQAGNETFPARYIADLSGEPLGAVIVLHASGQHPSWPFTVAALLDDLPLHGWSTLSIELPAPAQDATTAPAAASASTAKPNAPTVAASAAPANTQPPAAGIEPQAQARITAAVKYFTEQKQTKVVLLGFGSGATRAAEWARQLVANQTAGNPPAANSPGTNPPGANPAAISLLTPVKTEPIVALILIAPANRLIGLDQELPKILPSTELPTLDIILSNDPQALADAEARRRAVLHQRQRIYRRLELPPIAAAESAQHSLMVRRVRAWLQRQTTGQPEEVEIDDTRR